jgi:hypothetical protein
MFPNNAKNFCKQAFIGRQILLVGSMAGQGALLALLTGLSPGGVFCALTVFTAVGIGVAMIHRRWAEMPHVIETTVLMLTLANFSMVFGWWADSDFRAIGRREGCTCGCFVYTPFRDWSFASPNMLTAMLFGNLGMVLLRRECPRIDQFQAAQFAGGCAGMVLAMPLSHLSLSQMEIKQAAVATLAAYAAMSLSMLLGMHTGHAIVQCVSHFVVRRGNSDLRTSGNHLDPGREADSTAAHGLKHAYTA